MKLPNELSTLTDAYFHDELSAEEIDRLEHWLLEDVNHARHFAKEVLLYTELRSACLAYGDAECLDEALPLTPPLTGTGLWGFLSERIPSAAYSTASLWAMLWIACLSAGVGIGFFAFNGHQPANSDAGTNVTGNNVAGPEHVANANLSPDGPSHELPPDKKTPPAVARLTWAWKPQWSDPSNQFAEWSPLVEGQVIDLVSGRVEVFFELGAQLTLQGPIRFEVLGPKSGRIFHGDLTARIGEQAKGFSLISSAGKVIDLGTEFGMSVQQDGQTDVAVFDGLVDVEYAREGEPPSNQTHAGAASSRLSTGEAVRIMPDGSTQRIMAIEASRFARATVGLVQRPRQPIVISGVSDTMRTSGAGPFYEVVHGGLNEDALAYVDRMYEWNGVDEQGIPSFLLDADYIKTFNDDKQRGAYELTVELAQPSHLYVFWDDRLETPKWLREQFANTGLKLGMDEAPFRTKNGKLNDPTFQIEVGAGNSIDRAYSIWHRDVPAAGKVTLGPVPPQPPSKGSRFSMYGIAAVAK